MVALSPARPAAASHGNDLRRRIGVGVAVAWVLTQLWIASPLPFLLGAALGLGLVSSSEQAGWVHLALATAAAFLLFEGRLLRTAWTNLLLAVAGVLIVSYPLWVSSLGLTRDLDMQNLSRIPLPIDLVMTALAMIVTVFMAGRIFGRLGAILALVVLFPPSFIAGIGQSFSFTPSALATGVSEFLRGEIYFRKQFGNLSLQLSAGFCFLFVAVGVGLDHMGWGRKIGAFSSRFLARNAKRRNAPLSELLSQRIFTASFALAIILYLYGGFEPAIVGGLEALSLLGIGAGFYSVCYVLTALRGSESDAAVGMRFKVARTALGVIHFAALVAAATVLVFGLTGQMIEGLLWLVERGGLTLGGTPAPLVFIVAALLAALLAFRDGSRPSVGVFSSLFAVLPVVTLNWMMIAERLSAGLSAFYGAVVLLLCMLGWRRVCDGLEDRTAAVTLRHYLGRDLAIYCVSTARFMAGLALVAALYWRIALWWFSITNTKIF